MRLTGVDQLRVHQAHSIVPVFGHVQIVDEVPRSWYLALKLFQVQSRFVIQTSHPTYEQSERGCHSTRKEGTFVLFGEIDLPCPHEPTCVNNTLGTRDSGLTIRIQSDTCLCRRFGPAEQGGQDQTVLHAHSSARGHPWCRAVCGISNHAKRPR